MALTETEYEDDVRIELAKSPIAGFYKHSN
jgi:hypothetical protein